MKFAMAFTLLSAAAVKCLAIVVLWDAAGPSATIVVVWMAFGTWLTFAGAGVSTFGIRSFVGELNGTLAFYSAIVAFDCYALWWGLSHGKQGLTCLAAFFLVLGVGCWVAIRVSERRRAVCGGGVIITGMQP